MPKPITQNTLFYGDNLPILREHIPDESVDLIYLDPPFNSNRTYNVLFREEGGKEADSQIEAFDDTWHWNDKTQEAYQELLTHGPPRVSSMIDALRKFIGPNQMMAYLVMMAVRLAELHRVLKPTGSLYLHCDPTASHYLKIILDTVFGATNFRNEIVWKRTSSHNDSVRFGKVHDTILLYSKTDEYRFNVQRTPLDSEYVKKVYSRVDENGRRYRLDNVSAPGGRGPVYEWGGITQAWRYTKENMQRLYEAGRIRMYPDGRAMINAYVRYLDESEGQPVQDWWDDVGVIAAPSKERLGYPTQKPLALLERIIQASSNPDDLVLDPFCGCGTAVAAAQTLGRKWIGIDITHLAITLQKYRLQNMFPGITYEIIGEPEDLESARQLAHDDRYQFQWWALSLVAAKPMGGVEGEKKGKKGSDKGIDGVINFIEDDMGKLRQVIVQVKSGQVKSGDIRDLKGVLDREQGAIALFITLEDSTKDMTQEAVTAGYYHSTGWNRDFPKIQILTIAQLLHGAAVKMPPAQPPFKQAQKVEAEGPGQLDLLGKG